MRSAGALALRLALCGGAVSASVAGAAPPTFSALESVADARLQKVRFRAEPLAIAAHGDEAWVTLSPPPGGPAGKVARVRIGSRRIDAVMPVGPDPIDVAIDAGVVAVVSREGGQGGAGALYLFHRGPRRAKLVRPVRSPQAVAIRDGQAWTVTPRPRTSTVISVDVPSGRIAGRTTVAGDATGGKLAVGGGSVWFTVWSGGASRKASLVRLDASTNRLRGRFRLPSSPQDLSFLGHKLWVTLIPSHQGAQRILEIDAITNRSRRIRSSVRFGSNVVRNETGTWVAVGTKLVHLNPNGQPTGKRVETSLTIGRLAATSRGIWLMDQLHNEVAFVPRLLLD